MESRDRSLSEETQHIEDKHYRTKYLVIIAVDRVITLYDWSDFLCILADPRNAVAWGIATFLILHRFPNLSNVACVFFFSLPNNFILDTNLTSMYFSLKVFFSFFAFFYSLHLLDRWYNHIQHLWSHLYRHHYNYSSKSYRRNNSHFASNKDGNWILSGSLFIPSRLFHYLTSLTWNRDAMPLAADYFLALPYFLWIKPSKMLWSLVEYFMRCVFLPFAIVISL